MFRKIAALVVPALLLTACAQQAEPGAVQVSTGEAAVSALRGAPDAAADAGTAQLQVVLEITPGGSDAGEATRLTATGAIDLEAEQMSMTMDMGAFFDQLAATTGETLPPGLGGAWDFRVDGDTFYLRVPMLQMFTGADGWISMTAGDLGGTAQGLGVGAGTYDPSRLLDGLRGVGAEPVVVGEEEVGGVPTTHYRATIDVARAIAEAPEEQRAQIEAALEQVGDAGADEIPVDIWLDDDGLPRRMAIDLGQLPAGLAGPDASATLEMDVFGYGEPVDIDIPTADEVTPFREVAGPLGAGS